MKKISLILTTFIVLSSCVSKKKYAELESNQEETKKQLSTVKTNLQKCLVEAEKGNTKYVILEEQVKSLKDDKKSAMKQVENLTMLTQSSSNNIKTVIEQLNAKDKYINGIRNAMSRKDSINLALKYHLTKGLTDGIQDQDIEINVEKTVVMISISDKLLFKSGNYNVTPKAYTVLEKIASVIKSQPDMEVMVEGHTDSNSIKTKFIKDNWDLSVMRATSITRLLQYKYDIKPERLIAAGRSQYSPLAPNETETGRSKNRRTKIIIMPKLDEFFDILNQEGSN